MASPKKRVNPLFVALAVVLVAVVVAVGVVFFQLHSKISALQTGASFTFRYEIAPNSPDKPPLLNILERVNASSGSVSGQYAPGKLQLSFYQLNEDDSVKTSPFTRVYIDSEETLFDIGQLYTVLRQAVTDKLSIASVLLRRLHLPDAGFRRAGRRDEQGRASGAFRLHPLAQGAEKSLSFCRTGRLPLLSVPRRSRRHDPRARLFNGRSLLEDHAHPCAADHPGPQRPHPAHRHGDFCQDGAHSPGFPDERRGHRHAGSDTPERRVCLEDDTVRHPDHKLNDTKKADALCSVCFFGLRLFTGRGYGHPPRR